MDLVDKELGAAGGPFFLGRDLSLVDIVFVPFLERVVASIVYYKGLVVRGQGCVPLSPHPPQTPHLPCCSSTPRIRSQGGCAFRGHEAGGEL